MINLDEQRLKDWLDHWSSLTISDDLYYVDPYDPAKSAVCSFWDFTREVIKPNTEFPDGAIGIRVDDDFWAVAVLPYQFKDISLKTIVRVFWPEVERPSFHPDSGTWRQMMDNKIHRWYFKLRVVYHRLSRKIVN